MNNNLSLIFFLFISFFLFDTKNYSKVISWSFSNTPSLLLTDKIGVVESNMSFVADTNNTTNRIRIEDIVLDQEYRFVSLFTRFNKTHFSSFVKIKIYDVFTDNQLLEFDFYEPEIKSIGSMQIDTERVYLVAELNGNDIELRSVGMEMVKQDIITENNFTLSCNLLDAKKDNLEIRVVFTEAVEVTLLIYNKNGDICKEILMKKILDPGAYVFAMDPQELSFDYLSDKTYYVWLKAENLLSKPVEFIKNFQVIP